MKSPGTKSPQAKQNEKKWNEETQTDVSRMKYRKLCIWKRNINFFCVYIKKGEKMSARQKKYEKTFCKKQIVWSGP